MPCATDIFPEINIPVVTVIWSYTGLSTPEMEQRVTTYSQYSISANVNGIKDIEAQTMNGMSVQKIYFQPDVNIDLAIAQIVAGTNAIRALMPPGIQPPIIVQFNASSVPVLQISLSSDTLNEQQLYDYGIYRMRQQLAPIPGITLPTPSGGKYRQIMVDLDPAKLRGAGPHAARRRQCGQCAEPDPAVGHGQDRQHAVCGSHQRHARSIDQLNDIPVKVVNGATVFVKDVGQVHDGWLVQQNVVRKDGRRSVLLNIIKNGNASTLDVVNAVRRRRCKTIRAAAPPGMHIDELFDQSVFVKQADRRRAARGRDRRRPDRADDPAVPRLVALDAGGHDLDSAGDPDLAGRALLPRRDDQHHDARRPRARGRHPGRRFDGDHREHPSAADRGRHSRCRRRRCTARPASPCRRWSRRWPSAACSPRWSSSTGRPSICSRRSALPWCSPCSPPMRCRAR